MYNLTSNVHLNKLFIQMQLGWWLWCLLLSVLGFSWLNIIFLCLLDRQDGRSSCSPQGRWLDGVCWACSKPPEEHVQRSEDSQWCHRCKVSYIPTKRLLKRHDQLNLILSSYTVGGVGGQQTVQLKFIEIFGSWWKICFLADKHDNINLREVSELKCQWQSHIYT